MKYIGNKKTKQLHSEFCSYAKRIRPGNRVPFDSIQDAFDAGFSGCGHCLESYDEKHLRSFDEGYEEWLKEIRGGKDVDKETIEANDWFLTSETGEDDGEMKSCEEEMEECAARHRDELGNYEGAWQTGINDLNIQGVVKIYENGWVVWTEDYGAYAVATPVLTKYREMRDTAGPLGFPISDTMDTNTPGMQVALFEGGALFVMDDGQVFYLNQDLLKQYIGLDADLGVLGRPCSQPVSVGNGTYVSFMNKKKDDGRIYSIKDENQITHVFPIYGDLLACYLENRAQLGNPVGGEDWYPMREYVGLNHQNITRISYYWKKTSFAKGAIYQKKGSYFALYGPVWEKYQELDGEHNRFYAPVSGIVQRPGSGIEYADFQGGVIARHNDVVKALSKVELHIDYASTGRIDDGLNPGLTKDVTAELVVYLTVTKNGSPVIRLDPDKAKPITFDKCRLNYYDTSSYQINQIFDFSIYSHNDRFKIKLDYDDRDATLYNDSLGYYEMEFNIDNLWGWAISKDGLFFHEPLTHYNSDSSHIEKEKTVLTDFSIQDISFGKMEADPLNILPDCWWGFHNFERKKDFSYSFFTNVFSDMHKVADNTLAWVIDCLAHPSDHLFWSIHKGSGQGGLCFGMSTLALRAYRSETMFFLPLTQYRLTNKTLEDEITGNFSYSDVSNGALLENINRYYLYQHGKAVHDWKLKLILDGISFSPKRFFAKVEECLDKEKFCLVGLHQSSKGGHALLAYGTDRLSDQEWRVYLADPNGPKEAPFSTYLQINPKKNTSIIVSLAYHDRYKKEDYFKTRGMDTPLYGTLGVAASFNAIIKNTSLYYVPYSLLVRRPRTVNWFVEVLKDIIHLLSPSNLDPYKAAIFFTFGSCADIELEKGTESLEIPAFGGEDAPRVMIIKDATRFNTRLKGKKAGTLRCKLMNRHHTVDLSIPVAEEDDDTITFENENREQPSFTMRTSREAPKQVEVKLNGFNYRRKEQLRLGMKIKACTKQETRVSFDRHLNKVSFFQGGLKNKVTVTREVEEPTVIVRRKMSLAANAEKPVGLTVKAKKGF